MVTRRYGSVAQARDDFVRIDLDDHLVSGQPLLSDHDAIVVEAAGVLRKSYELQPDPQHLAGPDFTLGELRALHNAVLGVPLLRDTFNRRMREHLRPAGRTRAAADVPLPCTNAPPTKTSANPSDAASSYPEKVLERPASDTMAACQATCSFCAAT